MTPRDLKIEFNGIVFNTFLDENETNIYMLNNLVEAFSTPDIKANVSEFEFTHGASHGQSNYGRNTAVFSGHIVAETQVKQKEMKDNLSYALGLPMYRDPTSEGFFPFKITDEVGNILTNEAKVFQAVAYKKDFGEETVRDFVFGIEFKRHYFLTENVQEVTADDRLFDTNFDLPYEGFSLTDEGFDLFYSQGDVVVENIGNDWAPVIIEIGEGAVNPFIQNKTTGVNFKVNVSVGIGEKLVIDGEKSLIYTIAEDGTKTDKSAFVDLSAEWVFLDRGQNQLIVMDENEYTSDFSFTVKAKSSFQRI